MDWERMKARLEAVLNTSMQIGLIPETEWNRLVQQEGQEAPVKSVIRDHDILFYLTKEQGEVRILQAADAMITASERQLVELMVESKLQDERKHWMSYISDDERKANQLREWLLQQMEHSRTSVELPDMFVSQSSLYSTKIPLLLYGDYSQNLQVSYTDLKKLLESFFEAEIILIPLMEKEWLILGSEALLASGDDDREDHHEESMEQGLDAIGSGLHEMLANEWVGDCHLAIHYPIKPAKSLLSTILQLRETIMLGRTFHVGRFIHLPWQLHLEKLLHRVEEDEKNEFLDRVLRGGDYVLDSETMMTLDHFFALDCNVSETAKKLYIHRNTLLYRLDKFKNETGFDVRSFNHAVLVRLALLLYKVTKRK
ncbi:helix-turn-helix domain-containing protein [Paenibacillus sp. GP183]|uniref:PucR family transcriptional regulator n=1 Tax=Paenibacillus sp. GP183 TaxID=1882751 RepID=UPI0008997796|nr:helix-turn-helix domain-containing protein [Paenibacillus sp. GP183]SEC38940.1 PucR C-terminal helix-turn-helix domain-containing protein [Paenibacillus sp. GP183]